MGDNVDDDRRDFVRALTASFSVIAVVVSIASYVETRRQADAAERALTSPDRNRAYADFMQTLDSVCISLDRAGGTRPYSVNYQPGELPVRLAFWNTLNDGGSERPLGEKEFHQQSQKIQLAIRRLSHWFSAADEEPFSLVNATMIDLLGRARAKNWVDPTRYFRDHALCIASVIVLQRWGSGQRRPSIGDLPSFKDVEIFSCDKFDPEPDQCERAVNNTEAGLPS